MSEPPFHIRAILFDILLSIATFFVTAVPVATLALVFITINNEEWIQSVLNFIVPIWTIIFYSIRRRFKFSITIIQIIITIFITIGFGQLLDFLLSHLFYHYLGYAGYIVPAFYLTTFILTKHVTDKYIITKYYGDIIQ